VSPRKDTATGEKYKGFTDEEKAAMKERARELKAAERAEKNRAEGEKDLLEKIAEMSEPNRTIAQRIHEIVTANAPELLPRTWYGMPAYARDGNIVCFYQSADKFNTRYGTLGFNDSANLDEGTFWPTAFAITEWNSEAEKKVTELVKKAVR